jgi:hypothetical protein
VLGIGGHTGVNAAASPAAPANPQIANSPAASCIRVDFMARLTVIERTRSSLLKTWHYNLWEGSLTPKQRRATGRSAVVSGIGVGDASHRFPLDHGLPLTIEPTSLPATGNRPVIA